MIITQHEKKRSRKLYWVLLPVCDEEDGYMAELFIKPEVALKESRWDAKAGRKSYYTYNEPLKNVIEQRFTHNDAGGDTDMEAIDWRELTANRLYTAGAQELRKAASAKAKELWPERSRTIITKGWKAAHCRSFLQNNVWTYTADEGQPREQLDTPAERHHDTHLEREIPTETPVMTPEEVNRMLDDEPEPTPAPVKAKKTKTPPLDPSDPMAAMAALFAPYLNTKVDEEDVKRIVREEAGLRPKRVVIDLPVLDAEIDAGIAHESFPRLLSWLAIGMNDAEIPRINPMLVGPPGTGKTHAAHAAATALKLEFYTISVGAQTTKSDLLGFVDAQGRIVRTQLREAYEHGGVFLLDEIDAGNANVLTILNAALANGICPFPDKQIIKHENFRCVAAANTYGRGGDRLFVGRNQLDAASLDRFTNMYWDVDERLEAQLALDADWTKYVQKMRRGAQSIKAKVVISPRASINGGLLVKLGEKWDDVEEAVLFKGIPQELREQIKRAAN